MTANLGIKCRIVPVQVKQGLRFFVASVNFSQKRLYWFSRKCRLRPYVIQEDVFSEPIRSLEWRIKVRVYSGRPASSNGHEAFPNPPIEQVLFDPPMAGFGSILIHRYPQVSICKKSNAVPLSYHRKPVHPCILLPYTSINQTLAQNVITPLARTLYGLLRPRATGFPFAG